MKRRLVAGLILEGLAGVVLLIRPEVVVAWADGPDDTVTRRVAQVLGARQLVQAIVVGARPTTTVIRAGRGIDVLHATSMVMAAVALPSHRKLAALSAAQAGAAAVLLGAD